MANLMNRALQPSTLFKDKCLYLTGEGYYHSICSQDVTAAVDKIKDLLTSSNTRLQGLTVLEIALQRNSEIFFKGQWSLILIGFLKDNNCGTIIKEHSCRIMCMLVKFFSTEPTTPSFADTSKIVTDLYLLMLTNIYDNAEWIESAGKCLQVCVENFPLLFEPNIEPVLKVIMKQLSYCVSANTFEALSECFAEIPNFYRCKNDEMYQALWANHYSRTLNTLLEVLSLLVSYIMDDPFADIRAPDSELYPIGQDLEEPESDIFTLHLRRVCQFVNLSKCLAKMLTKGTRYRVTVPIQHTLQLVTELFLQLPEKIKPTTLELQLTVSTLAQIHTAALGLLEALMLNFDLRKFSSQISTVLNCALKSSKLSYSGESISELRLTTWKILNVWLTTQGIMVSSSTAPDLSNTVEELFKDISPEAEEKKESSQSNTPPGHQKSKKIASKVPKTKSYHLKKYGHFLCTEALKVLKSIVYSKGDVNKNVLKKIYDKIIQVSFDINDGHYFPYPYDDELCRKNLYSVLLALMTVSSLESPDQSVDVRCVAQIFQKAMVDPSLKVVRLSRKATAIGRLNLAPVGPVSKSLKERQRPTNPREIVKRKEWELPQFISNMHAETVQEVSENNSRIRHNTNETEMLNEEYMEIPSEFAEQILKSHCNGDEVLEVRSSSQGQESDEEEDDDDDEEEEVEEEEERSYGEEEMNTDENMFVSGKLQILNPVHINQETVQALIEPESLRSCARTEANTMDNNKNIHLNGVRSIVPGDNAVASSSNQPTLANENGIYEEDIDNEQEGNIEEDDGMTFPSEKKVSELYDPPAKKQKIETTEVTEDLNDENERDSRSPTLSEMKADFCCSEVEDVKS